MSFLVRAPGPALLRAVCSCVSSASPTAVRSSSTRQRSVRSFTSTPPFASSPRPASTLASTSTASAYSAHIDTLTHPRSVTVTFQDGLQSSFHHVWLRDHCREVRSCHPATKQRLVDTASISKDIRPDSVRVVHSGIEVTWPATTTETSYISSFTWEFLREHSYEPALRVGSRSSSPAKVLWTSAIARDLPTVTYNSVMGSEAGVWEWVKRIDSYGFAFVSGIPPTPEATEALIRRIAFIRETHYGGFWDFTADLAHGDLAYSEQELRAHTDTTYFTDPCGLQLFHLLSPASSHSGGLNLLVDGFRCAAQFRVSHPELYSLFSTLLIPSHASGSGADSSPSGVHLKPLLPSPVFTHDTAGELVQVRWNGDDRDVVGGPGWEGKMEAWFEAVRVWEGIIRSQEAELWSVMEMGTAVIFDNRRVLHGRSAFTGQRRLCGAYVAGDDYRSRVVGLRKLFGGS